MIRSAYLAAEGFESDLEEDLRRAGAGIASWHGRLALSPDPAVACRPFVPTMVPMPAVTA